MLLTILEPLFWHTFFKLCGMFHSIYADICTNVYLSINRSAFRSAFRIPPDFDDTFVNVGIGSLLREVANDFPQSNKLWLEKNSNLSTVFDALKTYAYRPMSNNSKVNTIDPRTYMYLRPFLQDAMTKGTDIALVPTWVSHLLL